MELSVKSFTTIHTPLNTVNATLARRILLLREMEMLANLALEFKSEIL